MQLIHIDLDKLSVSTLNMRFDKKPPDVADLIPSVRARGILVPLIVRPTNEPERYEVVAGRRRYFAAKALAEEMGGIDSLPCAVLDPNDDAAAIEASLLENIARLDPDEMTQHETFVRLVKKGRTIPEIASTFGITELMVKRRLALGNLIPAIRDAYRQEEIDAETIRHLTLATKAQQKAWLKLFRDPEQYAPLGWQLKQSLFGGQQIATTVALFPLEGYTGQIVTDLFEEESYFADIEQFWRLQNTALAATCEALREEGWDGVELLEPGTPFSSYEYDRAFKEKGGKAYVSVARNGEVEIHKGWLPHAETRRPAARAKRQSNGQAARSSKSETSATLTNYLELHRHALVRIALLQSPAVALRMLLAHAIASTGHWRVEADPQSAETQAIAESVSSSKAAAAFTAECRAMLALLGLPEEQWSLAEPDYSGETTVAIFVKLLALTEADVMRVLTYVMAETIAVGSPAVEALGVHLAINAREQWTPDETFFDLLRERSVVNAMLAEVGGKSVADGNLSEKLKVQKRIIRDFLAGTNGRVEAEAWLPGYMAFPCRTYTANGDMRPAEAWVRIAQYFEIK